MKTVEEAAKSLGLTKWAIYKAIENQTEMGSKFRRDERLNRYMIPNNSLASLVRRKNG